MFLKNLLATLLFAVICLQTIAQPSEKISKGKVRLEFTIDQSGSPAYAVFFGDKSVIRPSTLGFRLNVDSMFYISFKILGTERKSFDETWQPVWGETKYIRNNYNQLTVHLQSTLKPGLLLDILFRVFEDVVGFRYVL